MKESDRPFSLDEKSRVLGSQVAAERDGTVARLCLRFSLEESEDIFQEACLRAFERLEQQKTRAGLRPWFQTVLRGILSKHLHDQDSNAEESSIQEDIPNSSNSNASSPCACGMQSLEGIRPGYREVLRAIVLDDRSTEEVARLACTTTNNIRVRLHRARIALRKSWKGACGVRKAEIPSADCFCSKASSDRRIQQELHI